MYRARVETGLHRHIPTMHTYFFQLFLVGIVQCQLSSPLTTVSTDHGPCHNEATEVCLDDGDGTDQMEALKETFNAAPQLDFIFLIDLNLNDKVLGSTKDFIVYLVRFLSLNYNFTLDPDHVRIAILVFNNVTTISFDGISNPEVAIDYCQFKDKINPLKVMTANTNTKLLDGLKYVDQIFLPTFATRSGVKRVLWVFSDASMLGVSLQDVQQVAASIKQKNVAIFTTAVGQCPDGWFDKLEKQNTMKRIAGASLSPPQNNPSNYFACLATWQNITSKAEILNKDSTIILKVDHGDRLCTCDVVNEKYNCNATSTPSLVTAIAAGVVGGIGGLVIIIIIIIIVVGVVKCRRNSKKFSQRNPALNLPLPVLSSPPMLPPPPRPARKDLPDPYERPKGPYVNYEEEIKNKNQERKKSSFAASLGHSYVSFYKKWAHQHQLNMPDGWDTFMKEVADLNTLRHLAVYSTRNSPAGEKSFARTSGFRLSDEELTKIEDAMTEGRLGGHVRASGRLYHVEEVDGSHLRGTRWTTGKKSHQPIEELLAVARNEYFVVLGVCLLTNQKCEACLKEMLAYASRDLEV